MSWGPNSLFARPLIAAALLLSAGAAMADILVVRSTGPSAKGFPPGKRLPESARISLKANDQLTVLDGRGTRVIRGPGTFTAGAPAAGRVASAAPAAGRRARIGAVRGIEGGELRPPSIWHVDVSRSSNVCVADPAKVTLWRADPAQALTLDIGGPGGRSRRLTWQPGSSTLAWPSDLAVAEGAEYRLSWAGGATPTTLRFRTMGSRPAGLEDMAQALIRNQCEAQLDLFIETVKLPG
ncbi:MAG TPA: hypothetical protein VD846_01035 [Allosphingosinicella sp.]|nr:hypothetical protein [Allosphingosinicella sp.]